MKSVIVIKEENDDVKFEQRCQEMSEKGYILSSSSCTAVKWKDNTYVVYIAIFVLPACQLRKVCYVENGYYKDNGMVGVIEKTIKPIEKIGYFQGFEQVVGSDGVAFAVGLVETSLGHIIQVFTNAIKFITPNVTSDLAVLELELLQHNIKIEECQGGYKIHNMANNKYCGTDMNFIDLPIIRKPFLSKALASIEAMVYIESQN